VHIFIDRADSNIAISLLSFKWHWQGRWKWCEFAKNR